MDRIHRFAKDIKANRLRRDVFDRYLVYEGAFADIAMSVFACLFVTHDLGVVAEIADRILVMEDGAIVESATRDRLFDSPEHPYTRRLLAAMSIVEGDEPSTAAAGRS
jgi:ABC-type dipeptide/oligopeptide/nickel transport system ATPase component